MINLALHLAGPIRVILAQRLRHELDVERGLHERGERVALALFEGFEQLARDLLEEVGEDLRGQGRGGSCYLGVYEDEAEERFVDVGADFFGLFVRRRCPAGV